MADLRAQVTIDRVTGLPEDWVTNNWAFRTNLSVPGPTEFDAVTTALQTFYTSAYAGTAGLPTALYPGTGRVKFYDLAAPSPRVPLDEQDLTIPTRSASTYLPLETSMVLSFQGERASGLNQARRRGRIFLPWQSATLVQSGGYVRFDPDFTEQVATAAETMLEDLSLGGAVQWTVWSQVDESSVLIDNGWVDGEPDTQRRRGGPTAARVLWPIPTP